MDRGAWWATVRGAPKMLYMTYWLNNSNKDKIKVGVIVSWEQHLTDIDVIKQDKGKIGLSFVILFLFYVKFLC